MTLRIYRNFNSKKQKYRRKEISIMEFLKEHPVRSVISLLAESLTVATFFIPSEFQIVYKLVIFCCISFGIILFLFWGNFPLIIRRIIVIGIFVTVIIAIIIGCIKYKNIMITDEITVKRTCSTLRLDGAYITADSISQLNKLKNLSSIIFDQCNFEDGVLSDLTLSLTYFCIKDCTGVSNYQFLLNFPDLCELTLENCHVNDDSFPVLTQERLNKVCIIKNMGFSNLSLIPMESLIELDFSETAVKDLTVLVDAENLNTIRGNNTPLFNLDPLAKLTKLCTVQFDCCSIQEVTMEFMSLRMKELSLANNQLINCSGFSNLTVLESVDLGYNRLTDVSWLGKSSKTLKTVILSGNLLTEEDIAFLHTCTAIENLDVADIQMQFLNIVENMNNLKFLRAVGCGLQDISILQKFPELTHVYLARNKITDISPLKDLGGFSAFVDLSFNNISDVSVLPRIASIDLRGNPLCITNNSFEQGSGKTITLDYVEGLLDHVPSFNNFHIYDCPADRKVAVEDTLITVTFFTSEDAFD